MNYQRNIPGLCAMLFISMGCCFGDGATADFSQLDQTPKLLSTHPLKLPGLRIDRSAVGKYWVFVEIDEKGCVVTAHTVEGPSQHYCDLIEDNLIDRQFTPPTLNGQPIRAYAFLPIPIRFK